MTIDIPATFAAFPSRRYASLMQFGSMAFNVVLSEGTFTIGSDITNNFVVADGHSCPAFIGTVTKQGSLVSITVGDKTVQGEKDLMVQVNDTVLLMVSPPDEHAQRMCCVLDQDSTFVRKLQTALPDKLSKTFQYDPQWRKMGTLEGSVLSFSHNGAQIGLTVSMAGERFSCHFKDATNGLSTYSGGRSVSGSIVGSDAIVDFNLALHLPCAISHHVKCPLAPKENSIAFAVEAGEILPF